MSASVDPASETEGPSGTTDGAGPVGAPWVVLALGVIAWAVVLAVPFAVARPSLLAIPVSLAALSPLVSAAWIGVRERRIPPTATARRARLELARRVCTLVLFPAGLAFGIAISPLVLELDAHPPTMRLLGALAFLAYGAAASVADPRPAPPGLVVKALPAVGGDPQLVRRAKKRAWLLGLAAVGGLVLAVVAPSLGVDPSVSFGAESGAAASTLIAVVAAALGTIVVAGFVGPATRRRRAPTSARRAQRVGLYLLVVAVGLFVWHTLATRG